ncbi:MAG: hypothetical protein IKD80_02025, partial [Selenomonadaceae bacterium]|nr:hypothetical protein [Selenomonadaceae bacterium]
ATVPDWRNDVTLPEDLSEEVARIFGVDKIPSTLPKGNQQGHQSAAQNFVSDRRARDCQFNGFVAASPVADREFNLPRHHSISHKKSTVSLAVTSSGWKSNAVSLSQPSTVGARFTSWRTTVSCHE